jgi:hypothetical protein
MDGVVYIDLHIPGVIDHHNPTETRVAYQNIGTASQQVYRTVQFPEGCEDVFQFFTGCGHY